MRLVQQTRQPTDAYCCCCCTSATASAASSAEVENMLHVCTVEGVFEDGWLFTKKTKIYMYVGFPM